jgi:hypothetical protein
MYNNFPPPMVNDWIVSPIKTWNRFLKTKIKINKLKK